VAGSAVWLCKICAKTRDFPQGARVGCNARTTVRPSDISGSIQSHERLEVFMSSPAPFGPIAELLERSLSIRHVYGEPVHHGDTTVIPVAQVAYGFGAGGGRGPGRIPKNTSETSPPDKDTQPEAQGAGGGGGVRMTPVGALEIGPQGTRFVHFRPLTPLLAASAIGLVVGWLVSRRGR
jgi:uncharacterized spore protein YtfJ